MDSLLRLSDRLTDEQLGYLSTVLQAFHAAQGAVDSYLGHLRALHRLGPDDLIRVDGTLVRRAAPAPSG